jgi:hypothetical protein
MSAEKEKQVVDIVFDMIPTILLKAARKSEANVNREFSNFRKISRKYKSGSEIGKHIEQTRKIKNILKEANEKDHETPKIQWKQSKKQLKMLIIYIYCIQ